MNIITTKQKPITQLTQSFKTPVSKLICFSLYSSSSSLPSSRRFEEESRSVRVSVWWDIEKCCFPSGINVFKIGQYITNAVRVNGIKGPVHISAFGDFVCLSRPHQEALSSTGISLVHVPNGEKTSTNQSLLIDLMHWVSQNPPPAHIFLISNNTNFSIMLHKLRMNNYNILLASNDGVHTPGVLSSAASIMWHWNELAKGENFTGRHFNQPPDGPYNSWYGHYRGPLEDPFDVPEQHNSSKAEVICESPQPVPKAVLKQIREVISSCPKGVACGDFRHLLAKNRVVVDKNWYGYKTVSKFVQSMPGIIKVLRGDDGRLYLHPVDGSIDGYSSSKVQKSEKMKDGNSQLVTKMVDSEPKLEPKSSGDGLKEEKVELKVEESPEKKESDVPRDDLMYSLKENNEIDSGSEKPGLKDENEMGVFKRWWRKWFRGSGEMEKGTSEGAVGPTDECGTKGSGNVGVDSNRNAKSEVSPGGKLGKTTNEGTVGPTNEHKTKCSGNVGVGSNRNGKSEVSPGGELGKTTNEGMVGSTNKHENEGSRNVGVESDGNGEPEVKPGFVTKVLSWFKKGKKNELTLNTLTEQSTEEPKSKEDSKDEVAPTVERFEDVPRSSRHELFSKETFWSAFGSFLRTYRASEIISSSKSRKQLARRLKTDGPLNLRLLQETDLIDLVDILISHKKLINEHPTKTPRFQLNPLPPSQKNQSDLISNSIPKKTIKKPSDKPRNEILTDCQKLVNELLGQYPEGFNMGLFKKMFLEKYGYALDHQKLGYPKLVSLLQLMSGVRIESAQVFRDGEGSMGSEVAGLPLKSENGESSWAEPKNEVKNDGVTKGSEMTDLPLKRELGPVEEESSKSKIKDDGGFSDIKEDRPTTKPKSEEDSSLLQILNSWNSPSNREEDDPEVLGSNPDDVVDCSKGKRRTGKRYTFVAESIESDKDKLIDGILGSLKKNKSGEAKMES